VGALVAVMTGDAEILDAAGVRATTDPRSLNPPCVLLGPPSFARDFACGGTATVTAYVVGPTPGNLDAWRAIDDLAERAGTALAKAGIDVATITPASYQADDNSALMPALQLTWTRSLEWPTIEGN
jgi:hypothetical protein